jgi:Lysozyme like domain
VDRAADLGGDVMAGPPSSPVLEVALLGLGSYLMWFGVHYWRDTHTRWPVDPLKSVLQGNGLPVHNEDSTETAEETSILSFSQGASPPTSTGTGGGGGTAPAPGPGGTYSNAQLQSLWIMVGGSSGKAAGAACIAEHESSGDPTVTSSNPDGGTNVGLWQLDTKGKGAGYTVAQLQDPTTNARLAVAGSSNGTDWSAWSTAPLCGL